MTISDESFFYAKVPGNHGRGPTLVKNACYLVDALEMKTMEILCHQSIDVRTIYRSNMSHKHESTDASSVKLKYTNGIAKTGTIDSR